MTTTPPEKAKKTAKGCLILFGIVFVFFWIIISSGESEEEKMEAMTPEERAVYDATNDTSEASVCARNEVTNMLKSPSTADFPLSLGPVPTGDNHYTVNSYVDAQNSFGAEIRTNFYCEVEVLDPDQFVCKTTCTLSE